MAKIKPFRAIRYNQNKTRELKDAVCPPYDVISPSQQEYFHSLSPYNFIRIILGKDVPGEDKYQRAADLFKLWQKEGVLIRDDRPAVYFYKQEFNLRGEKKTRLGFISLLRLQEESSAVFGHEHTKDAAKDDRFRLLKKVRANLSPIFIVFQDKLRIIQRIYAKVAGQLPIAEVKDHEGTLHSFWRIDDPDEIKAIESALAPENMFIADGHHRYEVAYAYRDLQAQENKEGLTGEEDYNYLMSYFTNTDPHGLVILPIHRFLKTDNDINTEELTGRLKEFFEVEEVKAKDRFFFLMQKAGKSGHLLGMYKDKKFWLLRLKNVKLLDRMMSDKPREYRTLDVAMLNAIVLAHVMGASPEKNENLTFSPHADEIIAQVDANPKSIGFFLNPVRVEQIIAVALGGNKMPPKSTYFYPKVLSGLTINKLE